ncbi:conserved hypothetical protein [Vibrio crassostreae]|uniref:hypothetical protein n=1 Tax=Vibrio crassostreae TaxID=246167 RepID=UPI001048CF33|nr:hypothetical protein [Vibrio crassostreae]TCN76958.1 hypothetical protein EDB37_105420 [Vibrio crassostreae]CAK2116701.1 conserved hypothetical protein [Vibrio crassostreae]CAK2246070.1 conserved hypothetical protein [Vibrio crassostreae]CAK2399437.1 conserved hypothetical protein [Vibrio crassostreae]CAK2518874.1 conserved hypothetical protein [Vibrio crassostreae]
MEKSQLAIYISSGSLFVSAISFLYAVRQSKINRKLEIIRAYDKVYHDASDMLLYHYKKQMDKPFVSDDKCLEKAVNNFSNAHWLEQTYGMDVNYPPGVVTDREKADFNSKVSVTYYEHERKKQEESFDEFINHQSPVFYLEDDEFSERFTRLMDHVTENLSYFSPVINKSWEQMRLLKPESVKSEYLALKRVNEHTCEAIEEYIDDPYLQMLLSIRHEYRQLNRTLNDRFSDFWFRLTRLPSRLRYRVKRKITGNEFGI